jgi:hypothetical protein
VEGGLRDLSVAANGVAPPSAAAASGLRTPSTS